MPVSPTLIGDRYRLVRQLGQGGMGRVWRGHDEVLGREVAVKELVPPAGVPDAERRRLRERSMREARAVARLNHPNVVRVFDVVTTADGDPWIVMEYVRARSLQDVLPVSPQRAAEIGLSLLGALRAAHQAGVVHRDVKPSNVLLADDGRVLLTDFGIATVPGDPHITQTGVMFGSPAYMAPERVQDSHAGPMSDLWSLGATLYAAVEGRSPFSRPTSMGTLAALSTEPVPPAPHAGPLTPVLNGLLRKDPALRMRPEEAERLLKAARTAPAKPMPTAVIPSPGFPPARPTKVLPTTPADTQPPVLPPPARPSVRRKAGASPLAVTLVLLALIALALLVFRPWDHATDQPNRTAPTATAKARSAKASSPVSSPEPNQSPPASPAGFQLPGGWTMVEDPSGFAIPIPDGWRLGHDDDGRPYWQDPVNGTFVLIDQSRRPKDDPVADWKNNEAARRDGYNDYHRIRIEAVDYWDKAADWEFTYTSRSGTPLHVLNRGFVTAPDQAYSIYWSTQADSWDAEVQRLQVVFAGFDPARS
jgi:serine/threonine protein kinase